MGYCKQICTIQKNIVTLHIILDQCIMKTNLRQKYNSLLQRFIRLFSLTSVAFVVTACYGSPYAEYEVEGKVYNEEGEPLDDIQVVVRTFDDYSYSWPDTIYTNEGGEYHTVYGIPSCGGDCMEVIVHDPNGVYESDSVHIGSNKMKLESEESWSASYSMKADFYLEKK